MRKIFCENLLAISKNEKFVFLTGDLGFMALEPLQNSIGERFINVGVAEQNMVSIGAALSKEGHDVWLYSIAPFLYARALEQIRNDVALHNLPVKFVGNGGGYGYGPMGATHHSIEDYGILLTMPKMKVFVPAFSEDLPETIERMENWDGPSYLRLARSEPPKDFSVPAYQPLRHLLDGDLATLLVAGPLVGEILGYFVNLPKASRPSIWVLSELPIIEDSLTADFLADLKRTKNLAVAEEHIEQGSAGQSVAAFLFRKEFTGIKFSHFFAKGYVSQTYGSQNFHRKESQLDGQSIHRHLNGN